MSKPRFVTLPDDVRSVRIPIPGGHLAALRSADGAPRPGGTALLVPGYTGSKEDFIAVVAPLTRAGFHIVAIDLRGQNQSPAAAPDDADAYTLARLGQDVLDAADAVSPDEPVHLLGHSFGGLVARAAALANPSRIRSLTLLCTGPAAIPNPSAENAQLLAAAAGMMSLPDIWTEIKRMEAEAGQPMEPDPEIEEFMHRRFIANDPAQLIGTAHELTTAEDRVAELKKTGLPIYVACGVDDDAWPVEIQRDMAGRLGAPFHLIEDSGHSPAVDNPDGTVAYLTEVWTG